MVAQVGKEALAGRYLLSEVSPFVPQYQIVSVVDIQLDREMALAVRETLRWTKVSDLVHQLVGGVGIQLVLVQ